MGYEAEMPGTLVTQRQLQIICNRYYFAGCYVSGKTLEVGCGPGIGLGYLSRRAEVIGGDFNPDNLAYAKRHYNGRIGVVYLDAHKLQYKDKVFNTVLAMAVANYLDMDKFLKESYRVLITGGKLVFCIPNPCVPGFRPSLLSNRYYSLHDLRVMVKRYYGYDTTIFGVFSEVKPPVIRNKVVKLAGKCLNNKVGDKIRVPLSRKLLKTVPLPPEIAEGMAEYIEPDYLLSDEDTEHLVFYVVGEKL